MSQRFEGKNLDEALTMAADTLGVERWQLTYHVLLEKRGFLGGVKRIVVEADVNDSAASAPAAVSSAVAAPVAASVRAPREGRPPRERGARGPKREGRGPRGGGGRNRGSRQKTDDRDELQSGDFEKFFADVPEQTPESEAAKSVREWCETVVKLTRLEVVARTEENETQILIRLYGPDGRRLTDRHGELLDAIQVLANKALTGRKVEKEIELDCDAFKEKRNGDLEQRAREVADRVRSGGHEELLPAMSPIERRIVHIALRDDAEVTTESRGEGFYKRVAIVPRSMSQAEGSSAQPATSEP